MIGSHVLILPTIQSVTCCHYSLLLVYLFINLLQRDVMGLTSVKSDKLVIFVYRRI